MSDSEDAVDFNYENYIVRHHEDSDSLSSWFSLELGQDDPQVSNKCSANNTCNGPVDQISNTTAASNESDAEYVDLACQQVPNLQLKPDETFIFILGMLNRIENYLTKLQNENDKTWLKSQVCIVKTILLQSCKLFTIDEIQDVNGTVYIRENSNQTQDKEKKKQGKKSKNKAAKTQTKIVDCEEGNKLGDKEEISIEFPMLSERHLATPENLQNKSQENICLDVNDQMECRSPTQSQINGRPLTSPRRSVRLLPHDENQCTDHVNDQIEVRTEPELSTNRSAVTSERKSKRLQEQLDGNVKVFCDRLTYVSMKLPSFTSTPIYQKLIEKANKKDGTFIKEGENGKQGRTNKRKAKSFIIGPSKKAKGNVKTAISDKGATALQPRVRRQRKKKEKNTVKKSKRKSKLNKEMCSVSLEKDTSSMSSSDKRKLYSEDTWLQSLSEQL